MTTTVKIHTRVLPGSRIEVTAPQLREGQDVEVLISSSSDSESSKGDIVRFLNSLQPTRTLEQWEEFDREFKREREAWDR